MSKNREEEYLRRMKERGYVPSLAGMDDEDIEWELDRMGRGQEGSQPMETMLNKGYQPVDRDFAERIFKMFARPFDPKWQMPNLDGPEYRQPQRESRPEIWPQPSRGNNPKTVLFANTEKGGQGDVGKKTELNWSVDPLGMFPQYGARNQSASRQTDAVPTAEHPQYLWDEHIWKSPEVIGAQTPKEKREAVNRILAERQGDFGAAYKAAYGDKAADRWENDKRFTLGAMGDYVSPDQLKAFGWQNVNDEMTKDLNNTLIKYDITTPARMRHFLAQSAKESKKGRWTTELYDGDPYEYFENKYGRGNRPDLENTKEGDGYKYRGGGYIQTTGKVNYRPFAKEVGDPEVMERGADRIAEKYPWLASGFWWKNNDMNTLVDRLKGVDHDADVDKVTDVVNLYTDDDSRTERKSHYKDLLRIIPD